jgi:nucleoid-associated protein YgaU
MKRTIISLIAVLVLTVGMVAPSLAQDKMTYEEYQAELATWQGRETAAQGQIDVLNGEIEALRAEIAALDGQIAGVWQEIYDAQRLNNEDLAGYASELDALAADIAAFSRLSPEEIYQQNAELDALKARLMELKKHRAANLTEYSDILARMSAQLDATYARMAKPRVINYTVVRGDHLWKISSKSEHFGDGTKWMRIYSVNYDQISNPDMIFPDQQFIIPLDIDKNKQYLVGQGDHLYGIAESLFNDPFQWRKLYEANKDLIKDDPNYIVPEMILEVPER